MRYVCMMLACLLMVGCQEEELFPDYGEGTGTLVISGLEVETVVGDIQTRASVNETDIPEEFTIVLVNIADNTPDILAEGTHKIEAGSYKITASGGESDGMSYTPFFSAEKDFTIANGETKNITLKLSLQNAILHPKLDDALIKQYETYTLSIRKDNEESVPLTNDKDFYLAVNAEEGTYYLTLLGKNKLGKDVSHTWEYPVTQFVANTRYTVKCNPDVPEFTMSEQVETDAWSKFIYITPMTAANISYKPEGLTDDDILTNVKYEVSADGQVWIQANEKNGRLVAEGLNPSTSYSVRANFLDIYSTNAVSVTTESGAGVPNGDFEELEETINISGMNQGGRWTGTNTIFSQYEQNTCDFTIKEPVGWTSVNGKTCSEHALNKNSWFVVPSTYNTTLSWVYHVYYSVYDGSDTPEIYNNLMPQSGSNAMVIRNVAWDLNGTSPSDQKKTAWTKNDCYNTNTPSIANKSAGKLFLGSYTYSNSNGVETYDEGIKFASRPVSLKGYYKYVQDGNDTNETGMVTVSILSGETVIGSGSEALTSASDYTGFDIPITYTEALLKATELRIMISSSNHASYNQSEETASIKTTNYNGRSESVSRGATLTVDNLTFSYEYPNNE